LSSERDGGGGVKKGEKKEGLGKEEREKG